MEKNNNKSKINSAKFIISTDTCVDFTKSFLVDNNIHYILMKYIIKDKEISEIYDSNEEFDAFYTKLKNGEMPTTTQINPFELKEYFEAVLKKEKNGDIIHVSLSSGLSTTYLNAVSAAEEINKTLEAKNENRRVYVIDSLIATLGMGRQVEKLIKLRDSGTDAKDAVDHILKYREHQQAWVIMSDLFHLRRGGRISGFKAAVGTMLNIKPVIVVTEQGKLAIENKVRGSAKAVKYVLSRMEKFGEKFDKDFSNSTIHVLRTSQSTLHDEVKQSITAMYPNIKIKDGIVGPIIGTHLGCGGVAVLWDGAPRLSIK